MEGTIIKGYSGFYYVHHHGKIYECSLRGRNRLKQVKFLPGDKVEFEGLSNGKGVIEKVLPRSNELIRPSIANVDQAIIVVSLCNPEPDYWLTNRLTILALWNGITPVLCFNKADLLTAEQIEEVKAVYRPANFPMVTCSAKQEEGIKELEEMLQQRISVFAGNSGVGKSSILNRLDVQLQLATGDVSQKLKKGKHTTRHVELFDIGDDTLVADTPGFSSLVLPKDLKREELGHLFPEFTPYRNECKFSTCLHKSEPACAIKEAVSKGEISSIRYEHYLEFLEEVIKQERSY